jgi:hypothetical protein
MVAPIKNIKDKEVPIMDMAIRRVKASGNFLKTIKRNLISRPMQQYNRLKANGEKWH